MKKIANVVIFLCVCCLVFAKTGEAEDPIIIAAPDTTVNKTPFTFTEQGVTISISQCSAYPADHQWNSLGVTYFACLASESITFSAEQPIKGLAINGWVKQNFTATSDHGTLAYLSDDYDDVTGAPVLTLSDVDNTSVTIHCDKQLRCFSVEVYFTANPDNPQGEIQDTVRFVALTAEAQDYSEDTAYSSPGHYSYWLQLAPESVYPQVWLDMYAGTKGDLSGEYSLYDYNVGDYTYVQLSDDIWDYEYAYDQEFAISKTENGYHVEGWIICENEVRYEFSYDGPIELSAAGEEALDQISDESLPITNKIIHDSQLLILRGEKVYTIDGRLLVE